MPAPLNWKSPIWGSFGGPLPCRQSCWQCIAWPARLQQAWILPAEGRTRGAAATPVRIERCWNRYFSLDEGLRKHHLSTHSQRSAERPLSPWSVWGLGGGSTLRLLSMWGNSRDTRVENTDQQQHRASKELSRPSLSLPWLIPGRTQRRRISLSRAETSIRATIPPETQPKKAAQAFFNWFPRNKHFSLKWNNLLIACYNQMRGQCTFCVCTNSHVKSCARSEWRFLFLPNQEIR